MSSLFKCTHDAVSSAMIVDMKEGTTTIGTKPLSYRSVGINLVELCPGPVQESLAGSRLSWNSTPNNMTEHDICSGQHGKKNFQI
jgi:hypothetical protein